MALKTTFTYPHLIVDLSYFIHLRIHSTIKWFLEEFGDEKYIDRENLNDYNFIAEPEFVSAYDKFFINSLRKFVNSHQVNLDDIILAKDCKRTELWRRMIYSNYKSSRDRVKKPHEPNMKPIFKYTLNELIPKLQERYSFNLVDVPQAEGDDIIAVLTKHFLETTDEDVIILANDMDICQLINNRVHIYDMYNNSLNEKCIKKYGSAKRMLSAKILQGDRSDDIPNICPRMGEKTALKCLDDTELLREKFNKYPEAPFSNAVKM